MVARDDIPGKTCSTMTPGLSERACAELSLNASRLTKVIAYFDDYDEVERIVKAEEPQWRIRLNGATSVFDVDALPIPHRNLLHALAVVGLPSAPKGTCKAMQNFSAHPGLLDSTAESAVQGPIVGLSFARRGLGQRAPHESGFAAAKTLLRAMARLAWFGWTEDDLHALRQIHNPLASPQQSPVEDGEVLLSLAEQRDVNEHFEDLAVRLAEDRRSMPWQDLRAGAMLYWNYSNGFRPLQLAKLNTEDVRIRWGSPEHPTPTVVVRVPFVKQRKSRTKRFSVRRMRRGHAGRHRQHRGGRLVNVVSFPTQTFTALVADYRKVAEDAGLACNQRLSSTGAVAGPELWNLTEIAGSPGETIYLSHLGTDKKTLAEMNRRRAQRGEPSMEVSALPRGWQDLLRMLVVKHLVAEKKTPGHAAWNVAHPARCLATCCFPKEPWETTAEDVHRGLDIVQAVSACVARNTEAVARWMSAERLTHAHPLVGPRKIGLPNFNPRSAKDIRSNLKARTRLSRLPGEKEFWELVRIALDEKPSSLFDELRLRACLVQVLMGLRVGEVATLPAHALHARDLTPTNGARPSGVGGRDRILYLRHFSEKQAGADARGTVWAEKSTSVITLFEEIIEQTVNDVLARTAPLRERLKAQNETGRIFPELDPDRPLDLAETYPRVTGNPVVCRGDLETEALLASYRETGDIERLRDIERRQTELYTTGAPLHPTVETFAKRLRQDGVPWRDASTAELAKPRQRFVRGQMVVRVSDLEDFLREKRPAKLSDQTAFLPSGGRAQQTHELLFLHPKRALSEGRNGGVCDITRYPFVGHFQPADIQSALQDRDNGLFAKYGKDDEALAFELNSHSIRHLHNNELFSAGVSDTVITHRFGRKTVAQSHEYDNRTLAQHLTDIEVPADALDMLEGPALDTFRLIETRQADGELESRFKAQQSSDGDDFALAFLAEAVDQVQLTPYGVCTASFVSEACPKHLTCLNGCSHLVRTSDAKTVAHNRKLLARFETLLAQCPPPETESAAQKTWREKLETDVERLRRLIAVQPGQPVFPEGDDHGSPYAPRPEGLR